MPGKKTPNEVAEEVVKNGGFLVNMYFDLHASSSDSVKNIMVGFLSKLTKERDVTYAVGEIDVPIEKDGVFSTWAEVKLLANDFSTLARLCSLYSPIGVEILKPSEVRLSLGEAQSMLLDISQTSQNFTRMIMEKVLSNDERAEFQKKMDQRAELGRKLLEKKG